MKIATAIAMFTGATVIAGLALPNPNGATQPAEGVDKRNELVERCLTRSGVCYPASKGANQRAEGTEKRNEIVEPRKSCDPVYPKKCYPVSHKVAQAEEKMNKRNEKAKPRGYCDLDPVNCYPDSHADRKKKSAD